MHRDMIPLNELADLFKVHPRTVLRHLHEDVNAYWASDFNPGVDLVNVTMTYFMELDVLRAIVAKEDEVLTPVEAVKCLKDTYGDVVPERTFRYRQYPAVIRMRSVVRHSRKQLMAYHASKFC